MGKFRQTELSSQKLTKFIKLNASFKVFFGKKVEARVLKSERDVRLFIRIEGKILGLLI